MLHLDDGCYALIECRLGSRDIEEGAKHLWEIKRLIRQKNETKKQMPLRRTHSVDQAGLKLRDPPSSDSPVLEFKACVTTAQLIHYFINLDTVSVPSGYSG